MRIIRCLLRFILFPCLKLLEPPIQQWVKPLPSSFILGTFADLTRSRSELILENAFLRQQVLVLSRQKKRPRLTHRDRRLFVLFAHWLPAWKSAWLVSQPETLLRWHRELFKVVWRRRSQAKPKAQPATLSVELIQLIWELANANRLWGAERIRGELLKLGVSVSKRTIQKYLKQKPRSRPRGQTWSTFVHNHAADIWACDFLHTYDVFFRSIFVFVIIELESRQIVHMNVTRSPSDSWVAQQWRDATPFGTNPKYLIRDNDRKYGPHFAAATAGTDVLRTPIRAPRANAFCERFMGSLRRECLDHILILSEQQLRRRVKEYVCYYNADRPHQGINQCLPIEPEPPLPRTGTILAQPILGGLCMVFYTRDPRDVLQIVDQCCRRWRRRRSSETASRQI